MDLGSDYDCDWDWHWDWHMVLLLTVTKCGHVKVTGEEGGALVFIAQAPCWTWELQRALGGLQKYLNEDLLLLYLWLITNLMAVEKAG